ncbi:MAG TPA: aminodeoxychorismate/anthranilate synthase component II [Bacteroidia bacterium]|nr:aminodeoxychorismate/anthranilate synthase component II [Bacteroidia bacterium]
MNKILLLDNYDSFTYNLSHLIEKVSPLEVEVITNDRVDVQNLNHYAGIVLSPGPGLPSSAGRMIDVLRLRPPELPLLGICLGMQAIAEYYGASLRNLQTVCHGQARHVLPEPGSVLFRSCPTQFMVGRYHSWVVNEGDVPDVLNISARDGENCIMAIEHSTLPVYGVQFHPESVLSEFGELLIRNWLNS